MRFTKSQLKMTENIAVLFVFFILLAFGMIFYAGVMKSNTAKEDEKNFVLNAIKISQLITFMPELQCSADNIVTDACVDVLKVDAFSKVVSENMFFYFDYFEFSDISLVEVYPDDKTWQIYERIPDDIQSKNHLVTYVPISIYNSTSGGSTGYSFGYLRVEVFEQ